MNNAWMIYHKNYENDYDILEAVFFEEEKARLYFEAQVQKEFYRHIQDPEYKMLIYYAEESVNALVFRENGGKNASV